MLSEFNEKWTSVYEVGDNLAVYNYNFSASSNTISGAKIKSVFTPNLTKLNFINPQNGYAVGENGTIRHTQNAGITWNFILATISGVLFDKS